MSSADHTLITLNCLVRGESPFHGFQVHIPADGSVADLKKRIKEERKPAFNHIAADTLVVWKVSLSHESPDLNEQLEDLKEWTQECADELKPGDPHLPLPYYYHLGRIFVEPPLWDHLHIVIKQPPSAGLLMTRRSSSGGSLPPHLLTNWSPRHKTIQQMYDTLMKERFLYVRGTPGSGKTTLMHLLHNHILSQDRSALVYTSTMWPPADASRDPSAPLENRLRAMDPDYPRQSSCGFLLIDDAQDTFQDHAFWTVFIKGVLDGYYIDQYRVVVFCSYGGGAAWDHPVKTIPGAPVVLSDVHCMSLLPRTIRPGVEVRGILLDFDEFQDVVLKYNRELKIDSGLAHLIFHETSGHVGAVCSYLRLILDKKKTCMHTGGPVTVDAFNKHFSVHYVMTYLSGPFKRGLPASSYLSSYPHVANVFRQLVESASLDKCDEAAIQTCHRNGWIYRGVEGDDSRPLYTFPSPLHRATLSWRLGTTNSLPKFESIMALTFQAIAKLQPSQLNHSTRRIGGSSTERPSEAQYQDEFYRCLLEITERNICISPEFASAQGAQIVGRIDFFIPVVKWGIELTRDGNRLNEHPARFYDGGAYGEWLKDGDMEDYLLLDFCSEFPRDLHPNMPFLFHVILMDHSREVQVVDNMKRVAWGPKTLLENHD